MHSERFVSDMVSAIKSNAMNEFKRAYRSVRALLIDDIQFFGYAVSPLDGSFDGLNYWYYNQLERPSADGTANLIVRDTGFRPCRLEEIRRI